MTVNVTTVDRLFGVNEGVAAKAPCRLATTGANITLAGFPVLDGFLVNDADRILVKDQSDQTQNGIYNAASGNWARAVDGDGNRDFVRGSRVAVTDGVVNGETIWMLIADNPVTVGQSPLEWELDHFPDAPPDGTTYGRDNNAWNRVLPLGGGTMEGLLTLATAPANPNDAATKAYVDGLTLGGVGDAPANSTMYGRENNAWTRAVAVAGDTMTGPLVLAADPTASAQAATKNYVDTRTAVAAVQGSFKHLSVTGQSINNHTVTATADMLTLFDGTNFFTVQSVNVACDLNTLGVNGLDSGTIAVNTWYALYVIQNPATLAIAALASLSFTAPVLPSGYTRFARVSAARTTAGGGGVVWAYSQRGRRTQYVPQGTTAPYNSLPQLCSGVAGTISATVFTPIAVSWAQVAPPTAAVLRITGLLAGTAAIAPNPDYGGVGQYTQSAPPIAFNAGVNYSSGTADILLETGNVYYASNSASSNFFAVGYEDNL